MAIASFDSTQHCFACYAEKQQETSLGSRREDTKNKDNCWLKFSLIKLEG